MELGKQVMNSIQKTTESDITWIIDVYALHKVTNSEVCKKYHPQFHAQWNSFILRPYAYLVSVKTD